MARCRATRLSAEETIPLTRFSARLERENTFHALCSLTWSRLLLVSKICFKCIGHFGKSRCLEASLNMLVLLMTKNKATLFVMSI